MTRMSIIALFVIAVALLGETQFSNAQSPESYPWCGIRFTTDGSSQSCYYTSREQCMATMFGAAGGLASRAHIIARSRQSCRMVRW
jgi:hypothetical protein